MCKTSTDSSCTITEAKAYTCKAMQNCSNGELDYTGCQSHTPLYIFLCFNQLSPYSSNLFLNLLIFISFFTLTCFHCFFSMCFNEIMYCIHTKPRHTMRSAPYQATSTRTLTNPCESINRFSGFKSLNAVRNSEKRSELIHTTQTKEI